MALRVAAALALCAVTINAQGLSNSRCTGGQKGPICCTRVCNGYGKACTIGLRGGLRQDVQCSLTDPIICDKSTKGACEVAMTVSNSHPQWVAVNPCLLKWSTDDWHQVKTLEIKTRDDYVEVNEDRQVHLEATVTSDSELYKDFDPDDFYLESKQRKSAHCSAVGDPHYNTFDGKYWHFYDGNRRSPTRVTLFRSTKSDFVVQAQVRGNPAVACGVAGRDGRNWVQVNGCGGTVDFQEDCPDERELGLKQNCPVVKVSGNTYTVTFRSGAWFRAQTNGWGMNLYAETVDYKSSCGICGNFDGNSGNDAASYQVNQYSSLLPCQKVCTKAIDRGCTCCQGTNCGEDKASCDIWEYVPTKVTTTGGGADAVPEAVAKCVYEPAYVDPIIGVQDVEDITDFLKQHTKDERREGLILIDDVDGGTDAADKHKVNVALLKESKTACQARADDSTMITTCRTIEGIDLEDVERKETKVKEYEEDITRIGLCKDLKDGGAGDDRTAKDCCPKDTRAECMKDAKDALALAKVTKKNLNQCDRCKNCDTEAAGLPDGAFVPDDRATCTDCTKCFERMESEAIKDCAQDVEVEKGPKTLFGRDQVHASISLLEEDCIAMMIAAGFRENTNLKNALCPQECNAVPDKEQFKKPEEQTPHGTCNNAKCECKKPWAGVDCSINENDAPMLLGQRQRFCNTDDHSDDPPSCDPDDPDKCFDEPGCPKKLELSGRGFLKFTSDKVAPKCRWLTDKAKPAEAIVYTATYIGSTSIACPVPRGEGPGTHKGAKPLRAFLQVSNNGKAWSDIAGTDPNTKKDTEWYMDFFSGDCQKCNEATGTCTENPNTCHIGTGAATKCYRAGDPDPTQYDFGGEKLTNPCKHCDPYASQKEFSYNFRPAACAPKFSKSEFEYAIVGEKKAGPLAVDKDNSKYTSPRADTNKFVKDAPGYLAGLRYKMTGTGGTGASSADWFEIDEGPLDEGKPDTCGGKAGCVPGTVRLKKDVNVQTLCSGSEYCLSNPTVFNGIFKIIATDKDANEANIQARFQVNLLNAEDGKRPFTKGGLKIKAGEEDTGEVDVFQVAVFENSAGGTDVACFDWTKPTDAGTTCTTPDQDAPGGAVPPMMLREGFKGVEAGAGGRLRVSVKETIELDTIKSLVVDAAGMTAGAGKGVFKVAEGAKFDYEKIDRCNTNGVLCKCHQFNGDKAACGRQRESQFALDGDAKPCAYSDATAECRAAAVTVQMQAEICKGAAGAEQCEPSGRKVQLDITVLNVDEPPTSIFIEQVGTKLKLEGLNAPKIEEDSAKGAVIGNLKCADPEDPNSCSFAIIGGTHQDFFAIVKDNAVTPAAWQLVTKKTKDEAADFEALKAAQGTPAGQNPKLTVKIEASDSEGKKLAQDFDVEVVDINEPPYQIKVSAPADGANEKVTIADTRADLTTITVVEDAPFGTVLAGMAATDPDTEKEGPPICSIAATDKKVLQVFQAQVSETDPSVTNLLIKSKDNGGLGLDFETNKEWNFGIRCVDQPKAGQKTLESDEEYYVKVVVTNAEEAPSQLGFTPGPAVKENTAGKVGELTARDADAGAADFTFTPVAADTWEVTGTTCTKLTGGGVECKADLGLKKKPAAGSCETPNARDLVKCAVQISLGGVAPETVTVELANTPDAPTAVRIDNKLEVPAGLAVGQTFGLITIEDPDGDRGAIGGAGHMLRLVSNPPGIGVVALTRRRARRQDSKGKGFTEASVDFQFYIYDDSYAAGGVGSDITLAFEVKDPGMGGAPLKLASKPAGAMKVTKATAGETGGGTAAGAPKNPTLDPAGETMTVAYKSALTATKQIKFKANDNTISTATLVRLYPKGAGSCPQVQRASIYPAPAEAAFCQVSQAITDIVFKSSFATGSSTLTVTPALNQNGKFEPSYELTSEGFQGKFYVQVNYKAKAAGSDDEVIYLELPTVFEGYCSRKTCSDITKCRPCAISTASTLLEKIGVSGFATDSYHTDVMGAKSGCDTTQSADGGVCERREGVEKWEESNEKLGDCIKREAAKTPKQDVDVQRTNCATEYTDVITDLNDLIAASGCTGTEKEGQCAKLQARVDANTYERDVARAAALCKSDPERNAAECAKRDKLNKDRLEKLKGELGLKDKVNDATIDAADGAKKDDVDAKLGKIADAADAAGKKAAKAAYLEAKKERAEAAVGSDAGLNADYAELQRQKLAALTGLSQNDAHLKNVQAASTDAIGKAVSSGKKAFKDRATCTPDLKNLLAEAHAQNEQVKTAQIVDVADERAKIDAKLAVDCPGLKRAAIAAYGTALALEEVQQSKDALTVAELLKQQEQLIASLNQEIARVASLSAQKQQAQCDDLTKLTVTVPNPTPAQVLAELEAMCPGSTGSTTSSEFANAMGMKGKTLTPNELAAGLQFLQNQKTGASTGGGAPPGGDSGGDSTVIIVVVVLIVLFIVAGIVAVYVIQSKKDRDLAGTMARSERGRGSRAQQAYNNPTFGAGAGSDEFQPGVSNPLYDWYYPKMTRQQCADHLDAKGDGAFVIRDSQATPGWHMLCVKTGGEVVHDKIRLTDEGKYELMPSMGDGAKQHQFATIPELVQHYTVRQPGMAYQLMLANAVSVDGVGNPMYGAASGGAYGDVGAYGDATAASYGDVGAYGDATAASYGDVGAAGYRDVAPNSSA